MAVDLVFSQTALVTPPINLVFGETDVPVVADVNVSIIHVLPAPVLVAHLAGASALHLAFALPTPILAAHAAYKSDTDGLVACEVRARHQVAVAAGHLCLADSVQAVRLPVAFEVEAGSAALVSAAALCPWASAQACLAEFSQAQQAGLRVLAQTSARQQVGMGVDAVARVWHQVGVYARGGVQTRHQVGFPVKVGAAARHQKALGRGLRFLNGVATGAARGHGARQWYQLAMQPLVGVHLPPAPPQVDPCYLPDTQLIFAPDKLSDGLNLVFWCERHDTSPFVPVPVTVPIRRAYIVINSVTLTRVSNGLTLPATGLTLGLDASSWTYGFTATLPAASVGDLEPSNGEPVELQASINGVAYRLVVEKISRERQFPSSTISVSGRGKNALLDAPYAPIKTFGQVQDRTAQQLMVDALTVNGAPIGWGVDFALTDWMVSNGAWSHLGSYISALNAIAQAGGGYLQPHPTQDIMRVLPSYPYAAWDWHTVSPDFILPSALVQRESIDWVDKPLYNRVYLSGQSVGVLAEVTRAGSAGDLAAQMVVDPLNTHADASRQRGRAILSDVGRQAMVGLRLPVLPETGIVHPGKFVQYVDGSTERFGLVRSVAVEAEPAQVWQNIGVQTYESV